MSKNVVLGFLFCLLFLVGTPIAMAQTKSKTKKDTLKNPFLTDYKNNLKTLNFSISDKIAKLPKVVMPKNNNFNFRPSDKNYYNFFNPKPKRSFNQPKIKENDILKIKYFNGKKITNREPKVKSTYSLGTFYTPTNLVRIEVRDFGLEDGDRIKIYLNGEVVQESVTLKNRFYFINIYLKKGFNTISIKALNQGYAGPNTAELEIYDGKGTLMTAHTWNISTGQVVSTGVVRTEK
ncbi:MAG: hypothetical protein QM486_03250 [Flavobacteriaceae bacterium]